jgi:hypothetical protein
VWGEDSEAIREGVTFYVKYLGSVLVDCPFGDEVSSEAVKTIVCMVSIVVLGALDYGHFLE